MKYRIFFIVLAVFVISVAVFTIPVKAQNVGIKISPVKTEEIVEPGETLHQILKVQNKSSNAKTLYVYLRDFKAEDNEQGHARLIIPGAEEGYFLASWIEAPTEGIVFKPDEEKEINYKIHIPPEAGPGGYFGAVVISTVPPKLFLDSEEKGAGISIAQQTASLILLRVKGDVDETALVREFNTDKDVYGTPFDINFLIRIENTGNVHVKPRGTIKIRNMFGQEIAVLRVNDKGGNILPGSTRRINDAVWSDKFGFGRYEARLSLSYGTAVDQGGQGKSSIFSGKNFWIIPWRIIIPTLLGLVILSGIFILLLKLYKNKSIKKAMEQAGMGQVRYVKQFQGPSPTLHILMILLAVFIVLFVLISAVYFLFFA